MHSQTALRSQLDKGWKNNSSFASPSIRRPTSFDGKRVSDNAGFLATYDAAVNGFDGQDILVGNTALKSNDCRKITVHYSFDTISGVCRLVYIDPELEENVLAENGDGSVTVQLKSGANYIGLYGAGYDGTIRITVE